MAVIADLNLTEVVEFFLRTNWGDDAEGTYRIWTDSTIDYSFPNFAFSGDHDEEDGWTMMSADQLSYARLAFELWDELIPIDLVEVANDDEADITFAYSSTTDNNGSYTTPDIGDPVNPGAKTYEIEGQQIWLSTDPNQWPSIQPGLIQIWDRGFEAVYLHEIGHALGLSHLGTYNGNAAPSDREWSLDNRNYSVMSYFGGFDGSVWQEFNATFYGSATPSLFDIWTIQSMYGRDMTTRAGDTVYGFNSTANRTYTDAYGVTRDIFNFADYTVPPGAPAYLGSNAYPIFTIWDGGGHDTLDASLYTVDQEIDLRQGGISDIGGYGASAPSSGLAINGNIAIAYGVIIEDAIGGSANDKMFGNEADNNLQSGTGNDTVDAGSGNDTITAGTGNDSVDGGSGNDVINADTGNDTINGGSGNDTIDGGNDDDNIDGGDGFDSIIGGYGNDTIVGGAQDDVIWGDQPGGAGFGIDNLSGGDGNDQVHGCSGDDTVTGGAGNDQLFGESGKDTLDGGVGNDSLTGGEDEDLFIYTAGADVINDFDADEDHIDLTGSVLHSFTELYTYASQSGPSTVFNFGGGNTLTLLNFKLEDIDPGSFSFSEAPPEGGDFSVRLPYFSAPVTTHVSALANGGFIVTGPAQLGNFTSAVDGWIFQGDGTHSSSPQVLASGNTTYPGYLDQHFTAAAALSDGSFMAVWRSIDLGSQGVPPASSGVRAQHFAADGTPLGAAFDVNAGKNYEEYPTGVVALNDNRFLFTWRAETVPDPGGYVFSEGSFARIFDVNGTPITGDMEITNYAGHSYATNAVKTSNELGAIYYTGASENFGTYNSAWFIQYLSPDGIDQGRATVDLLAGLQVGFGNATQPNIASLGNGYSLAVWERLPSSQVPTELVVQAFVPGGGGSQVWQIASNIVKPEYLLTARPVWKELHTPQAVGLDDGRYVVVWQDATTNDILARYVTYTGQPDGDAFTVMSNDPFYNNNPGMLLSSVAALSGGRFVVNWYNATNDNRAVVVGGDGGVVIGGTPGNDTLKGSGYDDSITGGAGNDTLIGRLGADTLDGGPGSDTADYSLSLDKVHVDLNWASGQISTGHASADILISIENVTGSAYADTLIGDGNDNHLIGGFGADTLLGGGGNNWLEGNNGDDVLNVGEVGDAYGGKGDDTILGGSAGDTYAQGDAGNDDITVYGADNTVYGNDGDDKITVIGAGDGNVLVGGAGFDTLTGGSGIDTAYYYGHLDEYHLQLQGDGSYAIVDLRAGSPDGVDILIGIDRLAFSDVPLGVKLAYMLDQPPVITGAETLTVSVNEGTSFVVDVDASDPDGESEGNGLTYSLLPISSGGIADAGYFTIDAATGVLSFASPPDFENSAHGPSYQVTVQVTDAAGRTDTQVVAVNLIDNPTDTQYLNDGGDSSYYTSGSGFNAVVGGNGKDTLTVDVPANDVIVTTDGTHLLIDVDGDGDVDLTVNAVEDLVIKAKSVVLTGDFSGTGLSPNTITYSGDDDANLFDASAMSSSEHIVAMGLLGNDTLIGGGGDDVLIGFYVFTGGEGIAPDGDNSPAAANDDGSGDNDSLVGGAGNDQLNPGMGNDTVDGGEGIDTLILAGPARDFTITYDAGTDTYTVVGPTTGTDIATGVEIFEFDNFKGTYAEFLALPKTIGAERITNSLSAGDQSGPKIAALAGGGYVAVWTSSPDFGDGSGYQAVRARVIDAAGNPLGPDFIVESTTEGSQSQPVVAALAGGGFVVTWYSEDYGDGDGTTLRARVFDAAGNAVGQDFVATSNTPSYEDKPAIAALSGGGFAITRVSNWGTNVSVRIQTFDASGNPVSADLPIAPINHYDPRIAALSGNRFVVTWTANDISDGVGSAIKAQIFNGDGTSATNVFIANSVGSGNQNQSAVATLPDGRFVVVWWSDDTGVGIGSSIKGRLFESSGTPVGAQFSVAAGAWTGGTDQQGEPVVTGLPDNGFLVTWTSNVIGDGSGSGIHGRRFDSSGTAAGAEFVVNSAGTGFQNAPSITTLSDGRVAVTFTSFDDSDGSGGTIRTIVFDANGGQTITGTANNEIITGTPFGDHLIGLGGNDVFVPGVGNDTIEGGSGDDVLELPILALSATVTLGSTPGTFVVTSNTPGLDLGSKTISGIETLRFSDWEGTLDELAHLPTPAGPDFIANSSTLADQRNPALAELPNGGFVMAWYSDSGDGDGSGIRARVFQPNGSALAADFVVNTTTASYQYKPSVAVLSDGRFVVTWYSYDNGDGDGTCIRARVFDGAGGAAGPDFIVNSTTASFQVEPNVAPLGDGFIITWASSNGDADGDGIRGRIFNASGNAQGPEFIVNNTTPSTQGVAKVAQLADGFVVTWVDYSSTDGDIRARLFDSAGNARGPDSVANSTTHGYQYGQAVTALADGGFVLAWESQDVDGAGMRIRARVFDSDGDAASADFMVNTLRGQHQEMASVAALTGGGFVVVWYSPDQGDGSQDCVRARVFDASGHATSEDFVVESTVLYGQSQPAVSALPDGGFVVSWQSYDPGDGSGGNVRARIFSASGISSNEAPVITSDGAGDTAAKVIPENSTLVTVLAATDPDASDTLTFSLAGGEDATLFEVRNGNELHFVNPPDFENLPPAGATAGYQVTVQISDGNGGVDTQNLTATVADQSGVSLASNAATITGTDEEDVLTGGAGPNTIYGLGGDDFLKGAGDKDTLEGGAGDDRLDGGAGADRMIGGTGNDTYYVDDTGDVVVEGPGGGTDQVYTTANSTLAVDAEVEYIRVNGNTGRNVTGNAFSTHLFGAGGNDTLTGGSGNDALTGGTGADRMIGGTGNDTYYVDDAGDMVVEGPGGGTDQVYTTANYTLAGAAEVEYMRVSGNTGRNVTGNTFSTHLFGAGGNDTLTGGAGNDTIDGKAGADVMAGGVGNDTYYVDDAGDQVNEAAGQGTDVVYASVSTTLQAGTAVDYLRANAGATGLALTGNEFSRHLFGGAGGDTINGGTGDDTIDGKGGADIMAGGGGNDIYYVDHAGDQVNESAGQGTDTVYASVNTTLQAGTEVEYLRANAGATPLMLTGNEFSHHIIGGSGGDTINGGTGADFLDGKIGSDVMAGGAGSDTYYVDNANDQVNEGIGQGLDAIYASVNYALQVGTEVDYLRANGGATGLALTGNEFSHHIIGGAGGDTLTGGAGNDALSGLTGDDHLFGMGGNDTLTGGLGNDTFGFTAPTDGRDIIMDFVAGADVLQVSAAGFGGGLVANSAVQLIVAASVGAASGGAAGYFVFDNAGADKGTVYWDATGDSSADAIAIATLSGGGSLAASDIKVVA